MIKVTITLQEKNINEFGYFDDDKKADEYINKIIKKYEIENDNFIVDKQTLPDKTKKEIDYENLQLIAVKIADGSAKLEDVLDYLKLRDNL